MSKRVVHLMAAAFGVVTLGSLVLSTRAGSQATLGGTQIFEAATFLDIDGSILVKEMSRDEFRDFFRSTNAEYLGDFQVHHRFVKMRTVWPVSILYHEKNTLEITWPMHSEPLAGGKEKALQLFLVAFRNSQTESRLNGATEAQAELLGKSGRNGVVQWDSWNWLAISFSIIVVTTALSMALWGLFQIYGDFRARSWLTSGACTQCGYPLCSGVCPECGAEVGELNQ